MRSAYIEPTLLWNETPDHSLAIKASLKQAEHFTCMVAFAKMSGFTVFETELRKCIENGMSAVFVVGIDFYQSDPAVFDKLLKLKARGDVEVYMGASEKRWIFHPKLYLFEYSDRATSIVGSANMTAGGLVNNHELSIAFDHPSTGLVDQVERWISKLVEDRAIVEATGELVEEYGRRHAIYSRQMALAHRRAERAVLSPNGGMETLAQILREMKEDKSEQGFASSVKRRATDRRRGSKILRELVADRRMSSTKFLDVYERLITTMHSSGLHRGKTAIARSGKQFRDGVEVLLELKDRSPAELFTHLRDAFDDVNRAGTNVITEILHLLDNKRYAVMNQNSVSGMRLANLSTFPGRPDKRSVNGERYARFCAEAEKLCSVLGVSNFSELDALLNYAYWRASPSTIE